MLQDRVTPRRAEALMRRALLIPARGLPLRQLDHT